MREEYEARYERSCRILGLDPDEERIPEQRVYRNGVWLPVDDYGNVIEPVEVEDAA
jgi:hypothetical protein